MTKVKKIILNSVLWASVSVLISTKALAQGFDVQELGDFGLPRGDVANIIKGIVSWLLGIFGFLGIMAFVIAGIFYLTAGGDAKQEETAKNAMKMGIYGIIVGLIGFVAIKAIDAMLRGDGGF